MSIYMYARMYACMYAMFCACVHAYMNEGMYVHIYVCLCLSVLGSVSMETSSYPAMTWNEKEPSFGPLVCLHLCLQWPSQERSYVEELEQLLDCPQSVLKPRELRGTKGVPVRFTDVSVITVLGG